MLEPMYSVLIADNGREYYPRAGFDFDDPEGARFVTQAEVETDESAEIAWWPERKIAEQAKNLLVAELSQHGHVEAVVVKARSINVIAWEPVEERKSR